SLPGAQCLNDKATGVCTDDGLASALSLANCILALIRLSLRFDIDFYADSWVKKARIALCVISFSHRSAGDWPIRASNQGCSLWLTARRLIAENCLYDSHTDSMKPISSSTSFSGRPMSFRTIGLSP